MAYRETARVRERKDRTRTALVEAATELVSTHGFSGVQVTMIAARAGVAAGTLYGYFPSKAGLFSEVFERASARELDAFSAARGTAASPPAQLAAMVATFAGRALANPGLARALIAEPAEPSVERARRRFRRAYAERFEAVLREGIRQGVFARQNPSVSSLALVGGIADALVGSTGDVLEDGGQPRAERVDEVTAFALRAVSNPG